MKRTPKVKGGKGAGMARLFSMALLEWPYLLAAVVFLLVAAGFQAIIPKMTGQVFVCLPCVCVLFCHMIILFCHMIILFCHIIVRCSCVSLVSVF